MTQKSLRHIRDLELICDTSVEFSSVLDRDKLLPKIMDAFVRVAGLTKGSIMLYDEMEDTLKINVSMGISNRARKTIKFKPGEGIAGKVFVSGEPKLIKNTAVNTQYQEFFDDKPKPQEKLLCIPLKFKTEILGVVNLHSRVSGEPFTKYDIKLLQILTNQAAVSLANANFYKLAVSDSLTNLYVHQYFKQRLDYELEQANKYNLALSLIMFDIDHFKKFNDTYGHQAGDFILIALAKLIKNHLRENDIYSRYGGEEFTVILPETDILEARNIAEKIRDVVESEKFRFDSQNVNVTISLGVANYNFNHRSQFRCKPTKKVSPIISPEELIKQADTALYQAKQSGRNKVIVHQ